MGKNRKGNTPQIRRKPLPKKKRKRDDTDLDDIQIITGNNMQEPTTQRKKKNKTVISDEDVIATIQLRQKVQHKKSLYYLEQLLLKHKMHDKFAFDVKEVQHGLNFLFYRG